MRLDSPTRTIELNIGALPTAALTWTLEYTERTQSLKSIANTLQLLGLPALNAGLLPDLATVVALAAPVAGLVRDVDRMTVSNMDAVAQTVIVTLNNNGTRCVLWRATLAVGDMLSYEATRGFLVIDTNGQTKGVVPLPFLAMSEAQVSYVQSPLGLHDAARVPMSLDRDGSLRVINDMGLQSTIETLIDELRQVRDLLTLHIASL